MTTTGPLESHLLPAPQRLERRAGTVTLPTPIGVRGLELLGSLDAPVRGLQLLPAPAGGPHPATVRLAISPDAGPHDEGYRLEIRSDAAAPHPVTIQSPSPRGLRHALNTLAQLTRLHGPALPAMVIEDAPSFDTRGVMLDVSRCKVPTMDSLRDAVDLFASLKINHLQLYTEHTFAYAGHEDVWRDVSPITPDEVRELDPYCAARGVELCPNQNCFGHLAEWLRLPRYAPLAETHGEWKFMHFDRSGPFSLCPGDPGSIELVRDLLGQLLPCFSSPRVNIGCDETFDVGQGRSRADVERRGRAAVYLEFVRRIADVARQHGKRPAMWADIALSNPEALAGMPDGVIGLAWGYEPDADFDRWCQLLSASGIEAWVCPGTSSWRSITGRTSERRENISRAAEAGAARSAKGMLVCDWGDTGHHQHWPIALIGLAHGAHAAWNAHAARTFDPAAAAVHALGTGPQLGPWLEELGDLDVDLRRDCQIRNASALFNDLYRCYGAKPIAAAPERFREMGEHLQQLGDPPGIEPRSLLQRELRNTLSMVDVATMWGCAVRERSVWTKQLRAGLAERLRQVVLHQASLWLERNRKGGLEKSIGYFKPVLERFVHANDDTLQREHPVA